MKQTTEIVHYKRVKYVIPMAEFKEKLGLEGGLSSIRGWKGDDVLIIMRVEDKK